MIRSIGLPTCLPGLRLRSAVGQRIRDTEAASPQIHGAISCVELALPPLGTFSNTHIVSLAKA